MLGVLEGTTRLEETLKNPVRVLLAPLAAVLAATVASFLFDVGVSAARGWSPAPGYVGACAGLALGAALVLGGLLGFTRRPELALAAWVALNVVLGVVMYASSGWLSAAGFAAVTWAALLPNDRRRESPLSPGIGVFSQRPALHTSDVHGLPSSQSMASKQSTHTSLASSHC